MSMLLQTLIKANIKILILPLMLEDVSNGCLETVIIKEVEKKC